MRTTTTGAALRTGWRTYHLRMDVAVEFGKRRVRRRTTADRR